MLENVFTTQPDRMRKVAEVIKANPEHFDMMHWYVKDFTGVARLKVIEVQEVDAFLGCGTKACIAGWAVHLYAAEVNNNLTNISDAAQDILGLTSDDAVRLFVDNFIETPKQAFHALNAIADRSEQQL